MERAERWRPVTEYEGLYEVSDHGRVRSTDRTVVSANRWGGLTRSIRGQLLKPGLDNHGYARVSLCRAGKKTFKKVHRLVCEAFLGPRPSGMVTRHGPGGQLDNRLANLSYGTPAQNHQDKIRDGTFRYGTSRGERHGMAKLTAAAVAEIRRRHAAGEIQVSLASEYGVTQAAISRITRNETWRLEQHRPCFLDDQLRPGKRIKRLAPRPPRAVAGDRYGVRLRQGDA